MNNVVNLTCLSCCPIVISNSQSRQVADVTTQSGSDAFVTGSLVYAGNQVNQMQKFEGQVGHEEEVEGQVSQNLLNQGREMAGVSKFVNIVELEQLKTSMVERSNSSITQGGDDGKNDEVAGRESPPPPPPPRNSEEGGQVPPHSSLLPPSVRLSELLSPGNDSPLGDGITVDLDARLNDSLRNLEGGRPDSPPPPPPPRIDPSILSLSPGFMGFGPRDPKTGGRLNTIEVPKCPFTSVEVTRENQNQALQLVEPGDPKTGGRLNMIEVLKPVEVTRTNPSNASQLIGGNESELWV